MAILALVPATVRADVPPTFKGLEQYVRPDEMTRAYIIPQRIVWASSGPEAVTNAQVLLQKGTGQPEMGQRGMAKLHSSATDTASMILDYGREIHGGLHLVMGSSSRREPSLVRIRFGESVQETSSTTCNSEWKMGFSTDDHAKRDIVVEIPRDGQIELGNTGFRFVRIDLLQRNTTISLKEAAAILRCRDVPYIGSFRSSDARLDSIWMTGAYTVHLNMQEYIWDGIKRDRLVWLGDMHPEVSTVRSVFGYNEVIPKSLDLACAQFPLPKWMNGMTSYSMWYLIIQYEWFMQNGDLAFLNRHRDYIGGLIDLFDKTVDDKGLINGNFFLDWPSSPDKDGVNKGVRALLIWAMQDAIRLCRYTGDEARIATCERIISRVRRHLDKPQTLKQAAALMAVAGVMKPEKAFKDYLVKGHAHGFSTFYGYYMLEAEALAGEYEEALNVIRQFWGGMLDMGATTFWEDFDLSWMDHTNRIDEIGDPSRKNIHGDFGGYCYPGFRCSLCHGWASGPTAWLSRHVLGVEIIEPGCRKLRICPHLGDLKFVEGSYPTPFGAVRLRHERTESGQVKTTVVAKPNEVVLDIQQGM